MAKHLLFVLLAMAIPTWPQASTGSVRGAVRDQSGAVVPGASLRLTNTATNVEARTNSTDNGFFAFPGVVPGNYRLIAEVAGMASFEATVTVQVQQVAQVDVVMSVAGLATEVQVADVTPVVVADAPTIGPRARAPAHRAVAAERPQLQPVAEHGAGRDRFGRPRLRHARRIGRPDRRWRGGRGPELGHLGSGCKRSPGIGRGVQGRDQQLLGQVRAAPYGRGLHAQRHQPTPRFALRDPPEQFDRQGAPARGILAEGAAFDPQRVWRFGRRSRVAAETV